MRTAPRRDAAQFVDQRGGNALAPMRSRHGQVVDVDLASLLLELGQHVGHEAADDGPSLRRRERDEGLAAEKALQIRRGGRLADVGGCVAEGRAEEVQHGSHRRGVRRPEDADLKRAAGLRKAPVVISGGSRCGIHVAERPNAARQTRWIDAFGCAQ